MEIVKKFGEYINESFFSDTPNTDNVYNSIRHAGLIDYFYKPEFNDVESPFLTSQIDSFGLEDTDYMYNSIRIRDEKLDYEDFIFYDLYVSEEFDGIPIDDNTKISLWIEFGENGYTDGSEPWCLYYSEEDDAWVATGGIEEIDWTDKEDFLVKLLLTITPAINNTTKYNESYNGEVE